MRRRVVTSYEHSDRKNLPDDLEDALRIARNLDPPDPVLEAAILRDIGDWNVVYGRQENIATAYEESWRILDGVDGGADLQRAWFAEQVPIYSAPIRSRYLVDDPGAPHGRVDLVFSVDQFGRTDNVEIVGAVPAGLLEEAAARQVFRSLFRPAVLDGRVVATDSAFSWRFQYDPSVTPQFRDNMALND